MVEINDSEKKAIIYPKDLTESARTILEFYGYIDVNADTFGLADIYKEEEE